MNQKPTREEIEMLAQSMYSNGTVVAPAWEQLGDITRGVWRERAMASLEMTRPTAGVGETQSTLWQSV